jgi:hypothetical protein
MMKYFNIYELVDKKTFEEHGTDAFDLFNPEALIALDNLREFFGSSVTVNNWHEVNGGTQWRGWRTPEKAKELGAPHSQHAKGNAFDCDIHGYTAQQARMIIKSHKDDPLLEKIMRVEGGKPWLHFDLAELPEGKERVYEFKA